MGVMRSICAFKLLLLSHRSLPSICFRSRFVLAIVWNPEAIADDACTAAVVVTWNFPSGTHVRLRRQLCSKMITTSHAAARCRLVGYR